MWVKPYFIDELIAKNVKIETEVLSAEITERLDLSLTYF